MLVYFYYLDKNHGWVTDYDGYAEFPKDYYLTCDQPVDHSCGYKGAMELSLFISALWDFDIYVMD